MTRARRLLILRGILFSSIGGILGKRCPNRYQQEEKNLHNFIVKALTGGEIHETWRPLIISAFILIQLILVIIRSTPTKKSRYKRNKNFIELEIVLNSEAQNLNWHSI